MTTTSEGKDEVFTRRTAVILAVLCAASLVATIVVSALATNTPTAKSAGTDAYSTSAVGYAALVRFLERAGLQVSVSRHGSASKAGAEAPLLLAEPGNSDDEGPTLKELAEEARTRGAFVVVVLPKWHGTADRLKPSWIERATLRPLADADRVLKDLEISVGSGEPSRPDRVGEFFGDLAAAGTPALPTPQVLAHAELETLLGSDQGTVIGRVKGSRTYVVADPDLFNTHGLGKGGNAAIAQMFFKNHLQASGLVIDESVHGFGRAPSLWAELFQFPLVLVTIHFGALAALVLWAMMGRFGRPEPAPPRLPPGKLALVDNTAELLGFGGFTAHSLRQYRDLTLREGAVSSGLPSDLEHGELVAKLASVSRARGIGIDLAALDRDIDALEGHRTDVRRMLTLGRTVHRFRKELTRGN
jgi:hypothetical protein